MGSPFSVFSSIAYSPHCCESFSTQMGFFTIILIYFYVFWIIINSICPEKDKISLIWDLFSLSRELNKTQGKDFSAIGQKSVKQGLRYSNCSFKYLNQAFGKKQQKKQNTNKQITTTKPATSVMFLEFSEVLLSHLQAGLSSAERHTVILEEK